MAVEVPESYRLGRFARRNTVTARLGLLRSRVDFVDQVGANMSDFRRCGRELLGDVIEGAGAEGAESYLGIFFRGCADHDDRPREATHD